MIKTSGSSKRGISPMIATILLIAITFALAIIIFLWARGFILEQVEKFGQNAEQVCDQINFDAEISSIGGNLYSLYITNRGNVPIYALDIKKIGVGKSEVDRRTISLSEAESTKTTITLERLSYDEILIIPVILGNVRGKVNKKPYDCPQAYGKKVSLPL